MPVKHITIALRACSRYRNLSTFVTLSPCPGFMGYLNTKLRLNSDPEVGKTVDC